MSFNDDCDLVKTAGSLHHFPVQLAVVGDDELGVPARGLAASAEAKVLGAKSFSPRHWSDWRILSARIEQPPND